MVKRFFRHYFDELRAVPPKMFYCLFGEGVGVLGIYAKKRINSVISDTAHEKAFIMVF